MRKIAPSILSADFSRLGEEIRVVEALGADWIHIDVMDGHFVPVITVGPLVVSAVTKITKIPRDVHLMIENPDQHLESFIKAGATYLVVHQEVCPDLVKTIARITELGAKPGVSINPATPVSAIEPVLDKVSLVLIMTVNPGFAGQAFIESCLPKIEETKNLIVKRGLQTLVEVDGGIKPDNAACVASAGADVIVVGSSIFGSGDYRKAISELRRAIL